MARRLTLIAGSGALPPLVCTEAQRDGMSVQVIDLVGRGDLPGDTRIQLPVSKAQEITDAVRRFGSTDLVVAGGVSLSDADREAIAGALGIAGRLARSLGDVALAMALYTYFRLSGVRVLGAHQLVGDLLAPAGQFAGPSADAALIAVARQGLAAARAIGRIDLGQAVVMSGRRPIAAEDAGGTDALLERVMQLREARRVGDGGGPLILVKALKPGQPKFVDLPTIGPETVVNAASAGIAAIAVEAQRSLVLEIDRLGDRARELGVAVFGLRAGRG